MAVARQGWDAERIARAPGARRLSDGRAEVFVVDNAFVRDVQRPALHIASGATVTVIAVSRVRIPRKVWGAPGRINAAARRGENSSAPARVTLALASACGSAPLWAPDWRRHRRRG